MTKAPFEVNHHRDGRSRDRYRTPDRSVGDGVQSGQDFVVVVFRQGSESLPWTSVTPTGDPGGRRFGSGRHGQGYDRTPNVSVVQVRGDLRPFGTFPHGDPFPTKKLNPSVPYL